MAFPSAPGCTQNTQNLPASGPSVGVIRGFEDIEYGSGGPEKLLSDLRAAGVVLSVEGDRLAFDAPAGMMTDDLLSRMRTHREELLGLIRGSSGPLSICCPWCRSADLVDAPEGLRCRGCDRLAWVDLPSGGWERADHAGGDLAEIDSDAVPVCPRCGRVCDVDRGPGPWGGDASPGAWVCSRCGPGAEERRRLSERWAGLSRRLIGSRGVSASRPRGESDYRDRLPAGVGVVDDPVDGERCPRCDSIRSYVVPVHGGESLRRDCSGCGRFLGNPVWRDATAVDVFVAALRSGPGRRPG